MSKFYQWILVLPFVFFAVLMSANVNAEEEEEEQGEVQYIG